MRMCVLVVYLVWCGAVWCRGVRWVGWGPSGQRPYLNSLSQTASSSVARRHGKVRTPQLLAVSSARLALRSHRAVAKQQGLSLAWTYCPDRKMYAAMAPAAHSSQRRPLRCMSFSFSVLALEYLADSSKSQTNGHNQSGWGAVVRSAGRPSAGSCTSSEAETSRKQSDSDDSCVYLRACRAWWSKPRRRECHNTAPLHRLHEHCIDGQWPWTTELAVRSLTHREKETCLIQHQLAQRMQAHLSSAAAPDQADQSMLASPADGAGAAKAALLSRSTYDPSERWAASFLARLHTERGCGVWGGWCVWGVGGAGMVALGFKGREKAREVQGGGMCRPQAWRTSCFVPHPGSLPAWSSMAERCACIPRAIGPHVHAHAGQQSRSNPALWQRQRSRQLAWGAPLVPPAGRKGRHAAPRPGCWAARQRRSRPPGWGARCPAAGPARQAHLPRPAGEPWYTRQK